MFIGPHRVFTSLLALGIGSLLACTPAAGPRDAGIPAASARGGGGGGGGGGSTTGSAAGALYGDLYVIERDGNGEPVLTKGTYVCQQPLAASCALLRLNYTKEGFDPEVDDPCAVQADQATLLQPVSFGRESVSRAPATVIDKSYAEALKTINLAQPASCGEGTPAVKLDPAGRITLCIPDATGAFAWKTIDAPLENLGLYRATMTTGCFGPVSEETVGEEGVRITVTTTLSEDAQDYLEAAGLEHLVCPTSGTTTVEWADMLSAAVFLAAGADKSAPISLDQVVNLNNYLGVNKWTYTTTQKVKTLTITYFPFTVADGPGGWFGYTRGRDAANPDKADNTVPLLQFRALDGAFFIGDVPVFGVSPPGVSLTAVTVCRAGFPLRVEGEPVVCDAATATSPNLANPVYGPGNIMGCGGANWFTQAAEHARKTIWYVHNWRVPVVAY